MNKMFQGKPVTVLREARKGDVGFDPEKEQDFVRLDDGNDRVVLRSELKDPEAPVQPAPAEPEPQDE